MSREDFYRRAAAANNHIQLAIADLLKLFSLKHCPVPNVGDPDKALSHILNREFSDEKSKRKLVEVLERPKIFQSSKTPLIFQHKIDIISLDVPLIEKLLKKIKLFVFGNIAGCQAVPNKQVCCKYCSHPCPICKQIECDLRCANKNSNIWNHPCENPLCQETKRECINAHCAACVTKSVNEQCGVTNATKGVAVIKDHRNTTFHLTLSEITEFLDGRKQLQNFSHCHNAQQLFKYLGKCYLTIINFLCDKTFFQQNAITFKARKERIRELEEVFNGDQDSSSSLLMLLNNISRQCIFLSEENNALRNQLQTAEINERFAIFKFNTGY